MTRTEDPPARTRTAEVPTLVELAPDLESELDALARRFRAADTIGIQVLTMVGTRAEHLLARLPMRVRGQIDSVTRRALSTAFDAASASRGRVPDRSDRSNSVTTALMGAVGGAGGLPTALAELPVTVTMLLRAIQGIAEDEGFDISDPRVRAQCLQVFAAAGPLARGEGSDLGFLGARVTLTGAALHGMLGRIAPRLATVLGQKVAAQSVPLLGAAAGAATNYAFTRYYQEMARVYFGLRRLAAAGDVEVDTLLTEFRLRLAPPRRIG